MVRFGVVLRRTVLGDIGVSTTWVEVISESQVICVTSIDGINTLVVELVTGHRQRSERKTG